MMILVSPTCGMVLIQNAMNWRSRKGCATATLVRLDVEILSQAEMRARQPFLSERFIASTYSPMDAQADPSQ